MKTKLIYSIQKLGLSDKAAKVYLASLELGESTIQQLAERARVVRTTLYYTIDELIAFGAITKTERSKKTFYIAVEPEHVLRRARERIAEFEDIVPMLQEKKLSAFPRPRMYFLYGVPGFKHIWEKIFSSHDRSFSIITKGTDFLDFVKEKYVLQEIIAKKKSLNISSRQLIVDSTYARKIVAKDTKENRISKIIPPNYNFPFTIVITKETVAFISPRYENMLVMAESENFAKTVLTLFNIIWDVVDIKK